MDPIFEELNGLESECRTYLVASQGEALVIDALQDRVDDVVRQLRALGLRLALAVDTHTHADHLSGTRELAHRLGAKTAGSPHGSVDLPLAEGDVVTLGALQLEVWATPGHTADSLCLVMPGRAYTGDTLLIGVTGRTDLPTGDCEAQWASLQRLLTLPEDTLVFPGHDYARKTHSTIGEERRLNKRIALGRERFLEVMREPRPAKPRLLEQALAWNTRPR